MLRELFHIGPVTVYGYGLMIAIGVITCVLVAMRRAKTYGVDPDILIDNDPIQEAAGIDQQLLKAIEVALEQIKDRKPLPERPADRTFKDLGLEQMP